MSPATHLRAVAEAGPLARITATPHLPWPDDSAKMVSASASPCLSPSRVDSRLQGGVALLENRKRQDTSTIGQGSVLCVLNAISHRLRFMETNLNILDSNNAKHNKGNNFSQNVTEHLKNEKKFLMSDNHMKERRKK